MSISEAVETAKQRLTALAACLKRYTRDVEAWRINWRGQIHPGLRLNCTLDGMYYGQIDEVADIKKTYQQL